MKINEKRYKYMETPVDVCKLHVIESQERHLAQKKNACGRREDLTKVTHMEVHMYLHMYIYI